MQKILTGWGIWLETIEIQDVKIASSSLFKHMQTEFRESSRMEAERITEESNKKIHEEKVAREKKFAKTKADALIREYEMKKKDELAKLKQDAKFHATQVKVEQENLVTEIQRQINEKKRGHELEMQ